MRTYLAGPMTRHKFFNFPAFDEAAARGRAMGLEIISPAEIDREFGVDETAFPEDHDWMSAGPNFNLDDTIRRDIDAIMTCEAIAMLPGWEKSLGAQAEIALARWRRMKILDARTFEPLEEPVLA